MTDFRTPGERIREERKRMKLTRGELAESAFLPVATIRNLELDLVRNPRWETLNSLGLALKACPAWIMHGDNVHERYR